MSKAVSFKSWKIKSFLFIISPKFIILSETNKFYRDISAHLLPAATTMENTLRLATKKSTVNEIAKYYPILLHSSGKLQDYLSATSIFFGGGDEKKYQIPFLDFFTAYMNYYSEDAKRKGQILSVTAAIPNDTIVLANECILRLIIRSFASQTIDFFPMQKKIKVQLKKEGEMFILESKAKIKPEDSKLIIQKLKDSELLQKTTFKALKKACSWYGGSFGASGSGSDIKFTATFRLRETKAELKSLSSEEYRGRIFPENTTATVQKESDSDEADRAFSAAD